MKQTRDHCKCADCEKFKKLRSVASTPEAHKQVLQEYHAHLRKMLRARHFDECLVSRSDQSLKGQLPPGDSTLRSCMDAMDQGKLKLPGFGGVQSKDSPELIQPDDDRILMVVVLMMIGVLMVGAGL